MIRIIQKQNQNIFRSPHILKKIKILNCVIVLLFNWKQLTKVRFSKKKIEKGRGEGVGWSQPCFKKKFEFYLKLL